MAEKVYTKNAPDAIGPYSQAVKVGGLVFTSGQIAINPATGNVEAKAILGQILVDGLLVEKNLEDGIAYLSDASSAGNSDAMLHLGACYFTGIGIDKNEEYALVLFRKSASLGNKKAIETLRKLNK